jgi:hypothetical protein
MREHRCSFRGARKKGRPRVLLPEKGGHPRESHRPSRTHLLEPCAWHAYARASHTAHQACHGSASSPIRLASQRSPHHERNTSHQHNDPAASEAHPEVTHMPISMNQSSRASSQTAAIAALTQSHVLMCLQHVCTAMGPMMIIRKTTTIQCIPTHPSASRPWPRRQPGSRAP